MTHSALPLVCGRRGHLLLVLVVGLLVIGPGKLPETAAALGRTMRDFRHALDGKDEAAPGTEVGTGGPTEAAPPEAAIAASTEDPAAQ